MKNSQRYGLRAKALDNDTAERMFAGLAADDAPQGYGAVAETIAAAAAPSASAAIPGEYAAMTAYRDEVAKGFVGAPRPRFNPLRSLTGRIAVAAAAGVIAIGGGVASAATGSLPDPVQQFAHQILGGLGVPAAASHANPTDRTDNNDATHSPSHDGNNGAVVLPAAATDAVATTGSTKAAATHGADVASVARSVEPGPSHGAAVCAIASDNNCRAGAGETVGDTAQPTKNHGAKVAAAAQSVAPGPGHGAAVCAIASDNNCDATTPEAAMNNRNSNAPTVPGHRSQSPKSGETTAETTTTLTAETSSTADTTLAGRDRGQSVASAARSAR